MTASALNFEPCPNAEYGCDNYLIAQVSQDEGQCRVCAAWHERERAKHERLYKATMTMTQGLTPSQAPEGLSGPPSASAGHPGQPCPTCQTPHGAINYEWAKAEGACCMCGSTVIPWGEGGAGFCPRCKDHSANRAECETCGAAYEDWNEGKWEKAD